MAGFEKVRKAHEIETTKASAEKRVQEMVSEKVTEGRMVFDDFISKQVAQIERIQLEVDELRDQVIPELMERIKMPTIDPETFTD